MTTPMTDEQRRIKSYLTAQAAKLEPAAIVAKVRDAMAELEAAAVAVAPSRFAERPAPDEWSGDEVMAHVAASDAYFGGGIVSILDDRPVPAPGKGWGVPEHAARPARARRGREPWGARGAVGGGMVPGARSGPRGALRARARGVAGRPARPHGRARHVRAAHLARGAALPAPARPRSCRPAPADRHRAAADGERIAVGVISVKQSPSR